MKAMKAMKASKPKAMKKRQQKAMKKMKKGDEGAMKAMKPRPAQNTSFIFDDSLRNGPEIEQKVLCARVRRALDVAKYREGWATEMGFDPEAMMIGALLDSGVSLSLTHLTLADVHARAHPVPFFGTWVPESESFVY